MKRLVFLGLFVACTSPGHVPKMRIAQEAVDGHGMLANRLQRAVESYAAFSRLKWLPASLSSCLVYFTIVPCANPCDIDPNLASTRDCEFKTKIVRPPWIGAFPFDGLYREIDNPEFVANYLSSSHFLQDNLGNLKLQREISDNESKLVAWQVAMRRQLHGPSLRPTTLLMIRNHFDLDHRFVFTSFAPIEDVQMGQVLGEAWQQFADAGIDPTCRDRCPVVIRVSEPGLSGLLYCSADFVDGIAGALYHGLAGCEIVLIQTPARTWIAAATTPSWRGYWGGNGGLEDFTCTPRSTDRGVQDVAQMTKRILSWEPFDLRTEMRMLGRETASVLGVRNMEPSRILRPYREKTTIRVLVHANRTELALSVISTITVSRQNSGSPIDYHEPDAAQQAAYTRALMDAFRTDFECSTERHTSTAGDPIAAE